MKKSPIIKIWGFIQLGIGILLIILGTAVFNDSGFTGKGPNVGFLVPGMILVFISFPILLSGFLPQIAKFQSSLQKETL